MIPLIYPPEPPPLVVELPESVRSQPEIFKSVPKLHRSSQLESRRDRPSTIINLDRFLVTQKNQGKIITFPIATSEDGTRIPIGSVDTIEVIADRQEYDEQRQVITAVGNVVMRFAQSVMTGDRLEINLADRLAVANGNVVLKRGEQTFRGEKFEYYLVQDRGVIFQAGGEISQSSLSRDLDISALPSEPIIPDRALSDRLEINQPISDVTSPGGIEATVGSSRDFNILDASQNGGTGGTINRLRFEAERIDFEPTTWQATNFRLTNDPFSPPELEIRANTATFKQIAPLRSELTTTNSRVVIDDNLTLPLLVSGFVFDNRSRRPGLFNIAFDGEERGGLYIERSYTILERERITWSVTPQYFLQRALFPTAFRFSDEDEGGLFNSSVFGLESGLNIFFSPRTTLETDVALTSLDFQDVDDNLRAKVAANQLIGNLANPYRFSLEYNFRERLFNGSLGFQTVYSSVGGVLTSPNIAIADTGVNLRYQASIQNINADTDRQELLADDRDNDRVNLTRYQGAAFLSKSFSIWQGQPLPPTKDGGLRYTPTPVVPYLQLVTGVTGVSSFYSNGDTQLSLRGSVGIQGQLGHFSRSWLDYTGFNVTYSQSIRGDRSPFLFDRDVDRQNISLGITQQIYGPIRLGFQTSFNLNDNDEISTDYVLEYSRRTHNITLRYNPVLEIGSISLRISDFNWRGNSEPFEENNITPVIQGVSR